MRALTPPSRSGGISAWLQQATGNARANPGSTQVCFQMASFVKKNDKMERQEGFTLIEIIAVLVIMGLLAAVAIPKYFDLQERARSKAIFTAVSEMQIRINQHFASQLLEGHTAGTITYTAGSVDTNLGEDFFVSTWNETTNHIAVTITYFPNPEDHAKNPMTRTELIEKPKIE